MMNEDELERLPQVEYDKGYAAGIDAATKALQNLEEGIVNLSADLEQAIYELQAKAVS